MDGRYFPSWNIIPWGVREFQEISEKKAYDIVDWSKSDDIPDISDAEIIDAIPDKIVNLGATIWLLPTGQRHREDGPALEVKLDFPSHKNTIRKPIYTWYFFGKKHRVDGPAVEWEDGDKHWYLNGKRHRADGPGLTTNDGLIMWWWNDMRYDTIESFLRVANIPDEERVRLRLTY